MLLTLPCIPSRSEPLAKLSIDFNKYCKERHRNRSMRMLREESNSYPHWQFNMVLCNLIYCITGRHETLMNDEYIRHWCFYTVYIIPWILQTTQCYNYYYYIFVSILWRMTSPLLILICSAVSVGALGSFLLLLVFGVNKWEELDYNAASLTKYVNATSNIQVVLSTKINWFTEFRVQSGSTWTTYYLYKEYNNVWKQCDDLSGRLNVKW